MNPTVVLVHGAMHTPWIFSLLRERLTARNIASRAVQLPSINPDSAAAQGLTEDVAVVRAEIEAVEGPVVLAALLRWRARHLGRGTGGPGRRTCLHGSLRAGARGLDDGVDGW